MCHQENEGSGEPDQFSPLSGFYGTTDLSSDILTLLAPSSEVVDTSDTTIVNQKVRAPIFGIVADSTVSGDVSSQSLGILFTYDIMTQSTRNALNSMFQASGGLSSTIENTLKALLPYLSFQTTKAVGIYWLPVSAIVESSSAGALRIRQIPAITQYT